MFNLIYQILSSGITRTLLTPTTNNTEIEQRDMDVVMREIQEPVSFATLSSKILTVIFSYLSDSHDRKSARLVCQHWYNLLVTRNFVHEEVFRIESNNRCWFRCVNNFEQMKVELDVKTKLNEKFNVLVHSKWSFFNLVLSFVKLDNLLVTMDIWSRLLSLTLKECSYEKEVLAEILMHSKNLETLDFCQGLPEPENDICVAFKKLSSMNIVNLNTKKIKIKCWGISKHTPDHIFSTISKLILEVFPYVSHLEFDIQLDFDGSDYSQIVINELTGGNRILAIHELFSSDFLQELKYCIGNAGNEIFKFSWDKSDTYGIRLKEMTISVSDDKYLSAKISNFITHRSTPEILHFNRNKIDDTTIMFQPEYSATLWSCLTNLLHLRSIDLQLYGCTFMWSEKWHDYLLEMNIKDLTIRCQNLVELENTFELSRNYSLESVHFHFHARPWDEYEHLKEADNVKNSSSSVIRNMNAVKSINVIYEELFDPLCLNFLGRKFADLEELYLLYPFFSADPSLSVGYGSVEVNGLRNLKILHTSFEVLLNGPGLRLPNLKTVTLKAENNYNMNRIPNWLKNFNCPNVETVIIEANDAMKLLDYNFVVNFVQKLDKLRNLRICDILLYDTLGGDEFEWISTIFKECPSLRILHFQKLYSYNIWTNKIEESVRYI